MATYYEDENLEERITYYMNKLYPPKPKVQPPQKTHNHNHDHDHDHDHDHEKISKSVTVRPATSQ